ncbi:hypothetical protein [Streptomyces griseocarneus]|uniref:hypothetical protein n=1 Tax=Streptomyces griseocarneus TaxID=51201 RepID=UPI00325B2144
MQDSNTQDSGSAMRHARFGALPERIAYEDMVEVKEASPRDPARDTYNPEGASNLLSSPVWRGTWCSDVRPQGGPRGSGRRFLRAS